MSDNNIQDTRSALNQVSYGASATYSKIFKNDIHTSAQLYYSNYDLYASNSNTNNGQRLIQENEVIDNGFKFQVNYLLEKNLNYNGGYQYTSSFIRLSCRAGFCSSVFHSKIPAGLQ